MGLICFINGMGGAEQIGVNFLKVFYLAVFKSQTLTFLA